MKRIKKVSQTIPTSAQIVDGYAESSTDGYSCDYINEHSLILSATEPITDRKKVWVQNNQHNLTNLFIKENRTTNCYVNPNTGLTVSHGDNDTSDYIYIADIQSLIITNGVNNDTYALYNSNKVFISGGAYTNGQEIDIANASYIRVTIKKTVVNTINISAISVGYNINILNESNYEKCILENDGNSLNETIIGKWLGKNLYSKTIYLSSLPNSTTKSYAVVSDTSIIENMWLDEANSFIIEGTGRFALNHIWDVGTPNFTTTWINAGVLNIKCARDKSSDTAYVTVRYTKTTD